MYKQLIICPSALWSRKLTKFLSDINLILGTDNIDSKIQIAIEKFLRENNASKIVILPEVVETAKKMQEFDDLSGRMASIFLSFIYYKNDNIVVERLDNNHKCLSNNRGDITREAILNYCQYKKDAVIYTCDQNLVNQAKLRKIEAFFIDRVSDKEECEKIKNSCTMGRKCHDIAEKSLLGPEVFDGKKFKETYSRNMFFNIIVPKKKGDNQSKPTHILFRDGYIDFKEEYEVYLLKDAGRYLIFQTIRMGDPNKLAIPEKLNCKVKYIKKFKKTDKLLEDVNKAIKIESYKKFVLHAIQEIEK